MKKIYPPPPKKTPKRNKTKEQTGKQTIPKRERVHVYYISMTEFVQNKNVIC